MIFDYDEYHERLERLEAILYDFDGDDDELVDLLLSIEEFESMYIDGTEVVR